MVAASTSASYSSVNQYDSNTILPSNRSIMGRRHLNSCSSCDSCTANTICPSGESKTCPTGHHFHHTRRPAMRQNKRCTFATSVQTSMTVANNKNGGPPTTTIVNLPVTHSATSLRLVPQPTHPFYRGSVGSPAAVVSSTSPTSHLMQSEYRLPRTMIESSSSANIAPIIVVVSTHSPMYPLPNTIVQSASCVSVSSTSSDMSSVSASIQAND